MAFEALKKAFTTAPILRILNDKIWVEWDGLETGITQELLDLGINKEDIVLGFYRPERRALTEFAIN